jgi:hypothetical protein
MASEIRVNAIKNRSGLGTVTFTDTGLLISGITSFSLGNTNLIVGSATSTGTASQRLQVTGGAYVSGSVGVGTTNPTQKLHLEGALYVNNPNSSGLVFSPSTLGAQYYPTESGSTSTARYWIRFDSTNNASYPYLTNRAPSGDFAIFSGTTAGSGEIERLRFKGGDSTQSVYFSNCNVGIGLTNPSYKTHIVGSNDILALESLNTAERTTLKLITNGSDWELGARGSAASPANAFYIYDTAAGAYRQVIDSSGNLLIGGTSSSTGTASQPLQVNGGAYFSGSIGIGVTNPSNALTLLGDRNILLGPNSSWSAYLAVGGNGNQSNSTTASVATTNGNLHLDARTGGYGIYLNWYSTSTTGTYFGNGATGQVGRIDASGNLTVSGNVSGYSDIRLKDNIQTIPNALDKVSKLRGVEFDRNDIEENPHQIGVIAQEVEEIIPEVVNTDNMGIKSVAYGNLVGLLIEAIKDLKEEVNELKIRLEEK